jgi:opacity protein-like surface antigen
LQSGGFNTVGPHPNTGSDNSDTFSIGGAIGTRIPRNLGTLRLECEGIYVDPFNTVTNSFPGPPGPITFFYRTQYSNRWAVLANCWFDIPINNCLDLYAGGGIGGGGATMSVDDFVVQGRGSSSDVVWQVGCGLVRRFNRVAVDLGYRYMDWGKSEVTITGGGNFTADVTSHQVFLGIRYNRLGDLFSYR